MVQEKGGGPVPPPGGATAAGRGAHRLTSRTAVLAVVLCAIALSLAYPVREYIAQRRQIGQLETQHKMAAAQVRRLEAEQQRLNDPAYVENQARARLNMCMRHEACYVIFSGQPRSGRPPPPRAKPGAWYVTLWKSVQQADRQAAR
jgi:cell division protein FtsB